MIHPAEDDGKDGGNEAVNVGEVLEENLECRLENERNMAVRSEQNMLREAVRLLQRMEGLDDCTNRSILAQQTGQQAWVGAGAAYQHSHGGSG